jgi:hypothetical protein
MPERIYANGAIVESTNPLPMQGSSVVTTQPIPVTQAPKASYQSMKSFTGILTTSTTLSYSTNPPQYMECSHTKLM